MGNCSPRYPSPLSFSWSQRQVGLCSSSYEREFAAGCFIPSSSSCHVCLARWLLIEHAADRDFDSRNGWNDSRDIEPSPAPARGGFGGGGGYSRGGGGGSSFGGGRGGGYGGGASSGGYGGSPSSGQRETSGYGVWRDGKHVPGGRNARMEKELFGEINDPSKQQTGINFEKYDDIPVEATGAGVPDPVLEFTNPPLDPVLLENIGYAHYIQPTPVQKYSIPIVALNRDLMACAQVRFSATFLR